MPALRPSFVVDTSVAMKWFVESQEADVETALRLLEAHRRRRCTLRAPEFLAVEVANALMTRRELTLTDVVQALTHLRELDLGFLTLGWATLAEALQISHACGAAVYDCYFLALALETGSHLVTADEAFLRKAARYAVAVSLHKLRLPA